jgi:hypothetical protein
MPAEELVEIRHEVAHMQLPSISTLRIAAQQAMSWIKQSYWLPQVLS